MQGNLKDLLNILDNKADVVDVVSDYISLEKKGNNHVGLCPFHADSNPSMSVSSQKGIYKCFTCGAGGGAINFVQNYEGIPFIEAVKKVAEKSDVDWKGYLSDRVKKINPEEQRGWEINKEALTFFAYNLENTTNDKVTSYVKSRDLTQEVIGRFGIGFSGDGSSLTKFLLGKGFTDEELVKYGLAKRRDDSSLVDYFINRLMFSINDSNGNIIGFSGRVIEQSKYSKYLNSPETPIFKKSSILYNTHNSRQSANLKKELIVVEGFMDVIALYKAGIENAIATMGTAFTKQHTWQVKAITKNVTLAFDSDAAGTSALISTGKALIKEGLNVTAVSIDAGKDFDELFKQGKDKVVEVLSNKKEFLEFYKEKLYLRMENTDTSTFSTLLKTLLETLSLYQDPIVIDVTLKDISKRFELDKEVVKQQFEQNRVAVENNDTCVGPNCDIYKPPFVDEHIPTPPQMQNREVAQEVKQPFVDNKGINSKLSLTIKIKEELIFGFIIRNEEAFQYAIANHTQATFTQDHLQDAWMEYKNNRVNGVVTTGPIIDGLSAEEVTVRLEDAGLEHGDMEAFEHFIKDYLNLVNRLQLTKLKEDMNNATSDTERAVLLQQQRNLNNLITDYETSLHTEKK